MADSFDLDAYLRRIGYDGDRAPTLRTLREIHLAHAQHIPFENLDPLLRRPMQLDAAWLQHKLVHERRGGWCFEQNWLLRHALHALGFRTTGLAARVMWNMPEGTITPRGHKLMLVHLDEDAYVADVGFGGLTMTAPLRLEPDVEQPTPHEPFRLVRSDEFHVMQARIGDAWKPLYRFTLEEQQLPDYEVSSWFLCSHPRSHFLSGLIVARPAPEGRYALHNATLTTYHRDGRIERHTIGDAAELREVLDRTFGITAPDGLEDAWERVIAPAALAAA